MKFLSVNEIATKWGVSERTVRNYCSEGKIPDAFLTGKKWRIPENAQKPYRANFKKRRLLDILKEEKSMHLSGGIYHKIQIDLTYNSNHIEGSTLTHNQTAYIFETNTIGIENAAVNVDDIVETANHFRCVDLIIDRASHSLSENFIKELHFILKNGTSDSRKEWFRVGEYKGRPNEVGGNMTVSPNNVHQEINKLLTRYNSLKNVSFDDILDFHVQFEKIHPFQDGNGRVGRLIMFKECLKHNFIPFIIRDEIKMFYYRGISLWDTERGFLRETCLSAQDHFKKIMEYFDI